MESFYHLVVIGSGPAGWIAARAAAALGARVAIIERGAIGGEGYLGACVPFQALRSRVLRAPFPESVRAAQFADWIRDARRCSTAVIERHRIESLPAQGVERVHGDARFVDDRRIAVGERCLLFSRALIATGSVPIIPTISGLEQVPCLRPEQIIDLPSPPRSVAVIGGGTRGVETAQCLRRMGSTVTLYERQGRLLAGMPEQVADVIHRQLIAEGVAIRLNCISESCAATAPGTELRGTDRSGDYHDTVECLVLACGRTGRFADLNLSAARVEVNAGLIEIGDRAETTNRRVFAAGDVCSAEHSVHAARAQGRLVVANALFFGKERLSEPPIPVCVQTDPGGATVGLSATASPRLRTIRIALSDLDADLEDEHPDAAVVIVHDSSGCIRGAELVSRSAASLAGELALAISQRLRLSALPSALHVYGMPGEALRGAADLYRRSLMTPFTSSLLKWIAQLKR